MNLSPPSIATSFSRDLFDSPTTKDTPEKENIPTGYQGNSVTVVPPSSSFTKPSLNRARAKFKALIIDEEPSLTEHVIKEPIISENKLALLGISLIPDNTTENEFLSSQGLKKKGSPISGKFGAAFHVEKEDQSASFIYKVERLKKTLINKNDFGQKFWRHGSFSPSRLNLPHLVKTSFYVVAVQLDDGRKEQFLIPNEKIKEFAQEIPQNASLTLEATIMEKAPGESLAELEDKISFHPNEESFHHVVAAIHEFLIEAHRHNFIHRDLKPENIIYDPVSKHLTIIDTGESSRLRSREKDPSKMETNRLSNPTTSTKGGGSRHFMSPRVIQGESYGSEIDFFSAGMLFLRLLNKNDFKNFIAQRALGTAEDFFLEKNPKEFLTSYLEHSKSEVTSQILEAHPEVKEVIDLYFQASGGGSPEAVATSLHALEQLKQLPYFQRK